DARARLVLLRREIVSVVERPAAVAADRVAHAREVDLDREVVGGDGDRARAQAAVDRAPVRLAERLEELARDRAGLVEGRALRGAPRVHPRAQRRAGRALERVEADAARGVGVHVEDAEDVAMRDVEREVRLELEALARRGVRERGGRDDLERDLL